MARPAAWPSGGMPIARWPVTDLTRMIDRANSGDPQAAQELLPLVYGELRRLAASKLAQQPPGATLQATMLVHEAWLKLAGSGPAQWAGRRHFFNAAAEAMRHILIDRARRKLAARHGAGAAHVPLEGIEIAAPSDDETLMGVNRALDELQAAEPEKAELVKLKFFVGLSHREIGEMLGVSERTVERHWAYAQAWLFERLSRE